MSLKGEKEKPLLKNIFLVYVVFIMLLAIAPLGNSGVLNKTTILSFRADHILHVLQFIPWAFFCIRTKQNFPLWFFWGIFFAVVSEGVQYLLPYRSFNVSDMLANGIGVVSGFVIFVPLGKELRANKS